MNPTQTEPRTEVSEPSDPRAEASGSTSPKLTPAEAEALARAILAMCFPSEPEAQARDVLPTSPPSEPEAPARDVSPTSPSSEPEAQARDLHPAKSPNPQSSNSIRNPHSAIRNGYVRHGLTAVNPAVTRSEKIRFNKFRRAMLDELNPHTLIEQYLTDQIILHRWKILQCDAAEAAVMRAAVYRDQHPAFNINDGINPKLGELKYNLAQLNTPAKRSDRSDYFLKLGYNAPELDKIHRYRKEHERALDRALKEWDNCRVRHADQTPCEPDVRRPRRTDQPSRAHRPNPDFTKRNPSSIDATPDESITCVRSDPCATQPQLDQTRAEDRANPAQTAPESTVPSRIDAASPPQSARQHVSASLTAPASGRIVGPVEQGRRPERPDPATGPEEEE